jgi:hypothetical protein
LLIFDRILLRIVARSGNNRHAVRGWLPQPVQILLRSLTGSRRVHLRTLLGFKLDPLRLRRLLRFCLLSLGCLIALTLIGRLLLSSSILLRSLILITAVAGLAILAIFTIIGFGWR